MELLWDPLFRTQLTVGALIALSMPLLGAYLHLRGEWLAVLGYSHMAGGGATAAAALAWPLYPAALVAATLAALYKGCLERGGNQRYAAMFLIGWTMTMLVAANSHLGAHTGEALLEGQLYFTGNLHLLGAAAYFALLIPALAYLSRKIMVMRFFPDYYAANQRPAKLYGVLFDLLSVAGITLAATTVGIIPAFALLFLVPWAAFAVSRGWRRALLVAAALGLVAYAGAFVAAVLFDQPFGPTFVLVLIALTLLRLVRPLARTSESKGN